MAQKEHNVIKINLRQLFKNFNILTRHNKGGRLVSRLTKNGNSWNVEEKLWPLTINSLFNIITDQ